MLWKQAPPIRLGQQANKRGQDQHDEGFRHCLLHRQNTIMSVACFDRVVGEQAGPEREGLAVQGRSNRNDRQNPETVSHWKTTFATFTWSWCSRTLLDHDVQDACSSGPRDNAQDDDVLIQKKTSAVVIKDIWERARVTHIIQSIPDSIVHTWYLCSKWW